jgi:alkylhydroperoxidase family enzyme
MARVTSRFTILLVALFSIGTMSAAISWQRPEVMPLPDAPGRTRPVRLARARLAPLPTAAWTDAQRRLAEKHAPTGGAGNAFATLLMMPDLADTIVAIEAYYLHHATLSPRHRELLVLRTSWLLNSQYLWSEHVPKARAAGLTSEDVRRVALGADDRGWPPFEATLLRMADQLFRNASVSDSVYRALTAEYDLPHTMDAVMLVGSFTTLGLLYNALGVQPDSWNGDRIPMDVAYRIVVPARELPLAVARIAPAPGTGLAVSRTFDRHPGLAEPRKAANYVNRQSTLSPRYRELMILRTGWDCQSEYEWAQHVGTVGRAREMGIPVENIARGPSAPGWSPVERALLTAADELYRDSGISDPTWASLSKMLPPEMVINAIMSAATYRQVSMALNTFGVQREPGDERFPSLDPK